MTETSKVVLDIADLHAWYGESKALHGMNFDIREGELVTLLGRNGAGKTTALRCIMGLVRKKMGAITYRGENVAARAPEIIARRGIAYCPEERGIFSSLSVAENLELPPVIAKGGMTVDEILELFPNLKARWQSPGTKLSGGEQQMLAMARALCLEPEVLLLDEPTEGLMPSMIARIRETLEKLKARGFTILLVEQNFRFASKLADRHFVVDHGKVVERFSRDELAGNEAKIQAYLGV